MSSRHRNIFAPAAAAILAAALIAGCGGDEEMRPDANPGDITLSQIQDQTIDEDGNTGPLSFTVSVANATVTATSGNEMLVPGSGITLGGSGMSRTITVTPAADRTGMAVITITARQGSRMATSSFDVTVRAVNDPPTIANVTDRSTEEGTALAAIPFTVGDPDNEPGSLTVTATSNNTGLIPAAGLVLGGSGANRTLTITPAATGIGSAVITLEVSDGTAEATDTFTVTVTRSNAVNDPPVNTVPGAQSTNENTDLVFAAAGGNGISVADADAGNNDIRVSLGVSPGLGTLTLAVTTGLSFQAGDGSGDATVTFSGTIAEINAALNGLELAPTPGFSGDGSLTITTNDLGNTGNGGAQQDVDTIQIEVVDVNDAPTVRDIADTTIAEDGTTGPLAFTIDDEETAPGSLTVTRESSNLDVVPLTGVVLGGSGGNRTVTVTPAPDAFGSSVITITVSDGQRTASMNFTLTVTAVEDDPEIVAIPDQSMNAGDTRTIDVKIADAILETPADELVLTVAQTGSPALTLTLGGEGANRTLAVTAPAGMNGTVNITLTVRDEANRTATDTFVMMVNNINDPPVLSVPGSQVLHTDDAEDGTGTITFTSRNPITISDDDVGDADMTLRLQAENGTTRVGALPAGVSRTDGADESDDQTLEGPIDGLNEVLDGLVFESAPGFAADDATLELTVNDNGAAGTGGAKEDNETIEININVRPAISAITNKTIDEDGTTGVIAFTISDFEQGTQNLDVTATSSNNTLVPDDNVVLGGSGGARTVTVTPADDENGTTTITVTVRDQDGGQRRDLFVVTVNAVNDAPVLTAPASRNATEDVDVVFNGSISVADIDDTDLTVSLEATDGTITLGSTVGLSFSTGDGSDDASVTFSGTTANVNAALDGTRFHPDPDFNGEALLAIEVDDGSASDDAIVEIDVNASNDAPVITTTDGLATLNLNTERTIELVVDDVDVGNADLEVTFVVDGGATLAMPVRAGLDFTTGDGEGGDTMLTFRGSLDDINDALSGAGGVEITPMTAASGDVTLVGTVSDLGNTGDDGVGITSESWVTTYANANTMPTISAIDNRTIEEDDDGDTATFTVGDGQTSPGNLEVTATSTGSVALTLTVGGSGANRTVTAVPAPDDNGSATVTVTVTDGALSRTETYTLTVTAVNDAPVIEPASIEPVTTDEDTPVVVSFAATDVDGTTPVMAISSDNTELLPNSAFSGLGTTQVTITPEDNLSGSATVTLTATDGTLVATRTFTVTVRAVNDAPEISGTYPELSVSDEEVGDGTFQVTIDATGGTVTLFTIADLTFVDGDDDDELPDGDGNQEEHMIFRGSRDAVNDALDGLIDSVDDGTITVTVSDLGVSPPTEEDPEATATICVEVGSGVCP